MSVMYPNITVQLVGEDGNAFNLIGKVRNALRKGLLADGSYTAGEIANEIRHFTEEATSGDYDHVIQTCMKWVNVT